MNIRTFLFTILASLASVSLKAQSLYGPAVDKETLQDFSCLLKCATGADWNLAETQPGQGQRVILAIGKHPAFFTKESYQLQSNGKDLLTITSSSPEGLVFGFYKHLRDIGFKFYLPDEAYSIIPKLSHPFGSSTNIVSKPFLEVRDFFGTGGFGSSQPDPDRDVERAWKRWKLRNGFGAAYHLSGHRGENYILENYELLGRNPNWLATPLTGNKHSDQLIKLNYLNKTALEHYVNWSLKEVTAPSFVPPPSNHSIYISMEPADGGNFLNEIPANAQKKLPSVSDQVYGAANLAAQKLDRLFPNHPNIRVNLFAYSSHAEPPTFPLHPRVLVQLIPYQFQNIAYGPSFIKLWSKKISGFLMYDYFRYPDANFDIPGGLTLEEVMMRLVHSSQNGSEGMIYETSFSKFATGIPLWIMGRYMTEGDANWKENLTRLTKDLYGPAASPVAALFQLFYNESGFGPQHLGEAAKLVQQATTLTKDQVQQHRLDELKLYLQYAHLVYESRNLKNGNLSQRTLPVAEFAWKLFPTKIIHAYRIMQLTAYAYLNYDKTDRDHPHYQKLFNDWFPDNERSTTAWSRIPQQTKNTRSDFNALLKNYKPVAQPASYSMKDVMQKIAEQKLQPLQQVVVGGDQLARGYFGVYASQPTTLRLRYRITGNNPQVRISAIDLLYTYDTALLLSKSEGEVSLKVPAGETTFFINAGEGSVYRIEAKLSSGFYFFDSSPRGKMGFYKSLESPAAQYTYDSDYYPSYIYIPDGATTINYKVQGNNLTLTNPQQQRVQSELLSTEHAGFENRRLKLKTSETGKIWKAEAGGNYNYNFFDIPDRYLFLKKK